MSGGYAKKVKEAYIIIDGTPKALENKLAEVNKGKRSNLFIAEFDEKLATDTAKRRFVAYVMDNQYTLRHHALNSEREQINGYSKECFAYLLTK